MHCDWGFKRYTYIIRKYTQIMNHLEIGNTQDLFFFDEMSPGCCYFLPNGIVNVL